MKALIFDLDGTLIDSVYCHTLAWQQSLNEAGLPVAAHEIHRYIGINGKLMVKALGRPRGMSFDEEGIAAMEARHNEVYRQYAALQNPLPGAVELLQFLRHSGVAHGVATTGKRAEIEAALRVLHIGADTIVVDGSFTSHAKPEPDLFVECQKRLNTDKSECLIVGDAVWDIHAARRAGILSIGLLSGGFGQQELADAGAMRIYRDAKHLLESIDELGLELP